MHTQGESLIRSCPFVVADNSNARVLVCRSGKCVPFSLKRGVEKVGNVQKPPHARELPCTCTSVGRLGDRESAYTTFFTASSVDDTNSNKTGLKHQLQLYQRPNSSIQTERDVNSNNNSKQREVHSQRRKREIDHQASLRVHKNNHDQVPTFLLKETKTTKKPF